MSDKIRVGYSRTVNLGNFESVKIEAFIEEEILEENDTEYKILFDELFKECEDFVLERCAIEIKGESKIFNIGQMVF